MISPALIAPSKARCYIRGVATIKEIRRANFVSLLKAFGSQAELARLLEVEPAYVSALLAGPPGGRNIGDRTARKLEDRLNKPRGWMDVANAESEDLEVIGYRRAAAMRAAVLGEPAEDVCAVPILEVRASMGAGEPRPGHDAVAGMMQLSQEWVRRNLPDITSPRNLRVITGYGNSMEPAFYDGDPMLVDIGVREARIDAIYVFAMNDELFIKTLQRIPGGGIKVISNNKTYEPYMIDEASRERVEILGRVCWVWNGRRL